MPEKILIVDDTPANMSILLDLLEPQGYTVAAAPNGVVALNVADRFAPDLILLDILMPELDGLETARRFKAKPATAEVPILFITAKSDPASLLEGFRAGAADYIVKPFQPDEVLARVRAHLKLSSLTRELKIKNTELTTALSELKSEMHIRRETETALHRADAKLSQLADSEARRWGIDHFIGKSRIISDILSSVRRLQNFASVNVLITGESGTGKELVARALHYGSTRSKSPFVPANCATIPDELAESMLFGHLKGSFTGAIADRKGFFELADGGTLFLDEIGDMPPNIQAKLLRVLEDGQVTPIGAATPRKVDVRIVAATNANLPNNSFRQDLFFRIAQFTVNVPPLRDRAQDIPLLADHFLKHFAAEMGLGAGVGGKSPRLSSKAYEILLSYPFPGNIRELKNIMERALIEASGAADKTGTEIQAHHLFLSTLQTPPSQPKEPALLATASAPEDLPLNLEKAESLLIQRALAQTNGNVAKAARLLGINRTRIYRRFNEGAVPTDP